MFHVKHGNFCDARAIVYDIKKAKSFYIDVSRETLTILEQMFFLFHVKHMPCVFKGVASFILWHCLTFHVKH